MEKRVCHRSEGERNEEEKCGKKIIKKGREKEIREPFILN